MAKPARNGLVTRVWDDADVAFLLRIELPDRPGALGTVASALGTVGADIVSLDVVERSAERVVDDLVVDLPHDVLADSLVSAAASVDGVRVHSIRPYAAVLDPFRELELLDAMVADPEQALRILAEGIARLFRAGWCLVVDFPDPTLARVTAASAAAPELPEFAVPAPLTDSAAYDPLPPWAPPAWANLGTELAAAPLGRRAVLVGRPAMTWLPAEVARLNHLCGIVAGVVPGTLH